MVKRNKLNLAAGILLVITAGLSIISMIASIESLVEIVLISRNPELGVVGLEWPAAILLYGYMIGLYLAQSIVYMLFGIKLIKRSKLADSFTQSKTIIIVMLVLVCCSLAFDPIRILSGCYVACIILFICSLCCGARTDSDNALITNGVAPNNLATSNTNSTTSNISNSTNNFVDNVENVSTKSTSDMIADKVLSLKKLKDDGVISDAEFDSMMKMCMGSQASVDLKSNEDAPAIAPKKTTRTRKTTTTSATKKTPRTTKNNKSEE